MNVYILATPHDCGEHDYFTSASKAIRAAYDNIGRNGYDHIEKREANTHLKSHGYVDLTETIDGDKSVSIIRRSLK